MFHRFLWCWDLSGSAFWEKMLDYARRNANHGAGKSCRMSGHQLATKTMTLQLFECWRDPLFTTCIVITKNDTAPHAAISPVDRIKETPCHHCAVYTGSSQKHIKRTSEAWFANRACSTICVYDFSSSEKRRYKDWNSGPARHAQSLSSFTELQQAALEGPL